MKEVTANCVGEVLHLFQSLAHGEPVREFDEILAVENKGVGCMFSVFTKLGDGEFLFVASREELEQAAELVQELNDNWPNEYVVRDSTGNNVVLRNP